jgi:CubicO group peptidase (beta-lactamase class C family)
MTNGPITFHSAWVVDGSATSTDAIFPVLPWWSFTKTVLAIAALRLVEAGKLELDTPRPGKPYTLRQLLLHRAGVPNYGRLATYHEAVAHGEDAWPRARLLEVTNAEKLDFSRARAGTIATLAICSSAMRSRRLQVSRWAKRFSN